MNVESTANYQAFLGRIGAEESLARYHLMEVALNLFSNQEDPQPPPSVGSGFA